MKKNEIDGDVYMVLVKGEYAGWFSIPTGDEKTYILRAALSSSPTIIDISELDIEIEDLPEQASGFLWNGLGFERPNNGN
jgi:hypothetical protein